MANDFPFEGAPAAESAIKFRLVRYLQAENTGVDGSPPQFFLSPNVQGDRSLISINNHIIPNSIWSNESLASFFEAISVPTSENAAFYDQR